MVLQIPPVKINYTNRLLLFSTYTRIPSLIFSHSQVTIFTAQLSTYAERGRVGVKF